MLTTFWAVYEQYYASLAASTAVSSANTPSGLGTPDYEEDRKPNVEYLDSLNDYRKRSRSAEDIGGGEKTKIPKVEQNGNGTLGLSNGGPDQSSDSDPMVLGEPL